MRLQEILLCLVAVEMLENEREMHLEILFVVQDSYDIFSVPLSKSLKLFIGNVRMSVNCNGNYYIKNNFC